MRAWLCAHWRWVLVWTACASLLAFAFMGADKRRAKRGAWRIPEKTLFLTALLGGSPGAVLGMWTFRHKTRHWYFRLGLPALLLAQLAALAWVLLGA